MPNKNANAPNKRVYGPNKNANAPNDWLHGLKSWELILTACKKMIQGHSRDVALIAVLGVVGLWGGLWMRHSILDDAMITFRVAENLAYGHGLVYNPGERVQVTTTPLYALLLTPGVWLFGGAPQAALVLNVALAGLIPGLAYDLGRRLAGRMTGVGGALLLAFAPPLTVAFSMESYLYVALILAALDAYVAGASTPNSGQTAGMLAGLTALARGDAALVGACLLTYDALATRRLRWRLILPTLAIPSGWYLFATWYYGSPFPATLGAKTAQGEFNWLNQNFLEGLWFYWDKWVRVQEYHALYLVPTLMPLSLIPTLRAERPWLILAGYTGLYISTFHLLGVPAAPWYYAPLMPTVALLTARGLLVVAEGAARLLLHVGPSLIFLPTMALLLSTLYPLNAAIIAHNPDWKAQTYPPIARWIATNTNTSANLATIDIGHLGYWSGRPIIDIVGLAQPDVAAQIAAGDFGYAIRHYQPDLILLGYSWLPEVQSAPWFQAEYAPRRYFRFRHREEPFLLLSRRTGVKVQPDTPLPSQIHPLNVNFNRQITLTGYHFYEPLIAGGTVMLTLSWQAQAPIEKDLTVFAHLRDATGQIVAQGDGKPQQGFYATPYWRPGEMILDTHLFPIPGGLLPGDYEIVVGLYDPETVQRLQTLDEAGRSTSDYVRVGCRIEAN